MTVKRGTTGTGITAKPTISWDEVGDEDQAEVRGWLETGSLEGVIASVERECFAIMEKAGLPTQHGSYLFDRQGIWRRPSPPFGGMSIANEIWPIARARGYRVDSLIGFASRMLGDVVWLRRLREKGFHDRAALMAYYLGIKQAELRIKTQHEPTWDRGRLTIEERAAGGAATRKGSDESRVERVRYYLAQGDKLTEAYRNAAKDLACGVSTVRTAWARITKGADASD